MTDMCKKAVVLENLDGCQSKFIVHAKTAWATYETCLKDLTLAAMRFTRSGPSYLESADVDELKGRIAA